MKTNKDLIQRRNEHVSQGPYNIYPIFIKKAHGAVMVDVEDREYIDFAGGIGVLNVGHNHPKVVAAIKDQADKFIHTCFHVGMYESYVDLAERLNEVAPGDFPKATMFLNSGAEAVENAIKVARISKKRPAVIAFDNAFHGRTLLGMTLTSKIKPYKHEFGPFAPEVYRMPYAYCYRCPYDLKYPDCGVACADKMEDFFASYVAPETVAAVIAEPIQGEGGFITPPPEYFPKLQEISRKYDIALIIDEVQAGSGRTGKFFAIEHWGIEPDIITTAKSLAAGMPLSAVTGRKELMNASHPGGLGGTYAGNPLACRAGLAVMDILFKDGVLEQGRVLGENLQARFNEMQSKYEIIGDVRGKGAMLALELVKDRKTKTPATDEAKRIAQSCFEKGLIILTTGHYGNVIRVLMPLVITDDQLDKGMSILEEAFTELNKG
ncbi:MAG: 4-aminobutyrate--2-oxoglutarate transaminase [Desulfobacterales bacterium]|nr:4-aminobutyrate--2-oxoglutarate transaminase [Desulfobacterales bacterium]